MMKLKSIINERIDFAETLYWMFFMLSIMFKCLYFQFTTRLNTEPYLSTVNISMLLSSFAVLLIITSSIAFIFNKYRIIALFVFNFLLTVLLLADTNFFRYYYNLITIPVFFQFDIEVLSSVNQSIMSLFKVKDIIYIVDLPLMLAGIFLLHKNIPKIGLHRRVLRSLILLVIGIVTILPIFPKANINSFAYSNNYSAKSLGVFYSHYYNTKLFIEENLLEDDILTDSEKEFISSFLEKKNSNKLLKKYNGIAKDKNLIIVQMEAIQQFVINRSINGKEITPNLNRIIKESIYFNNIHYQVAGGNTSDAEFLCNTSLYPAKEGSVYFRFPENTYYSLPSILKDKGYDTYSLHAFDQDFWNRSQMYKALKFDTFFSKKDFVMDDFAGWQGEALSDASFFRQSLDKIDTSKPFYSFFITLSNHHPFTYFEDFDFNVGEFEGTYIGNYLKAANYADKCIGQFVEDLKKRGLYDNSLIVLYGDHSAVPKIQADELMQFLGTQYSDLQWIKLQKVPLIIHYPGQKTSEIVNTTGGQIDLLPTIANLMDFDVPYALGKDLLNTDKGYAILRNGSVITKDYVYFNDTREVYDLSSGELLDISSLEEEITSYLDELNISDIILSKDAFKK
ncbi:MAG: LTA synthase family protein [Bacillota bacterium]